MTSEIPAYTPAALDPPQVEPGPLVVQARGLRVATSRGVVIPGVNVDLRRGALAAVVGTSQTGKSTLLLALTGRMRHLSGVLLVQGHDGLTHPARVRGVTSVARVADLIVPEGRLRVGECLTERLLMDAAGAQGRERYRYAARLMDLHCSDDTLYRDLSPADRTKVAVALAYVRPAAVLVIDDLDGGATLDEQRTLWSGLRRLSAGGMVVIASVGERAAIPADAVVIDLDAQEA